MKLLIIGGTRFLGRALVDTALLADHEVTLFNRGKSNPDIYQELEQLHGDRDGGLDVLRGRRWDAVIDTCGYFPRVVRDSAQLLADAVVHYTFISTLSVYSDFTIIGIDENSPLGKLDDETVEVITGETYGPLKVLCEEAVTEALADGSPNGRVLHVRSGLIVGPYDPSDRFTYWPHRVAKGGEVLAPGDPGAPVQLMDVRDIAEWTIKATEAKLTGPYNVTGPDYRLTMGRILDTCRRVTQSDATFNWVSDQFLQQNEVAAYTEIPLWIPPDLPGFDTFDNRKAINAGLTFRPLGDTVRDTLKWSKSRPPEYQWRAGLAPDKEAELLKKWNAVENV